MPDPTHAAPPAAPGGGMPSDADFDEYDRLYDAFKADPSRENSAALTAFMKAKGFGDNSSADVE